MFENKMSGKEMLLIASAWQVLRKVATGNLINIVSFFKVRPKAKVRLE